jgi:hypothetical protein
VNRPKLAGALVPALVGPASFAAAAAVGARKVPDYRHRDEPMSALAAAGCPGAPVMVPGFLVLGAATWWLGRVLDGSPVPRSIPRMMRATGVATAVAGLARQSDRSCPVRFLGDENVTVSDDVHVWVSGFVFGSWIVMPLLTATRGRSLRPVDRRRSLLLGLTAFSGWVWTSVLMRRNVDAWGGVAQRVTVAASLAWYPVVALAAMAAAGTE